MIALGAHFGFIAAAYVGTAVVIGGLVTWIAADARRTRTRIAALEAARERAGDRR
ncbi:heme exporter protein CcmD [Pelagibacterium montanilacus]|uniref:heme exporter protein CcmD n=1 Tax=Pelagibacterium montanilacus TaxID=2185280 RepID=UPI000F8E5686|nr:heme exporter protein CcmD [Pelagibacterium montanilacus]